MEKPRDQAILAFLENELGLQAVRQDAPDQAIRHFETALELDSRTVPASLNLGDVYMAQGRAAEAIAMWEQISRTVPERSYLAFERLERAYSQSDGPRRFVELCRRLIDANPQDWRARLTLGQHFSARGEPTKALDLFFESLVHNPHALACTRRSGARSPRWISTPCWCAGTCT